MSFLRGATGVLHGQYNSEASGFESLIKPEPCGTTFAKVLSALA